MDLWKIVFYMICMYTVQYTRSSLICCKCVSDRNAMNVLLLCTIVQLHMISHYDTYSLRMCWEHKKQYHGHKSKLWFLGINIIRSHKLKKACLNDFQPPRMKARYDLSDNLYSCGYFLVYCQGHGSQDNENCAVYLRCCKRKTNKATFTTL